jgi:cytochrome c553
MGSSAARGRGSSCGARHFTPGREGESPGSCLSASRLYWLRQQGQGREHGLGADAGGRARPARRDVDGSGCRRPGATRGKELYARYCTGCHGVDGRGEAKTFRPNVGNLAVKEFLDQVSDEYLFAAIKQGGIAVGKNAAMPAWNTQLDDGQIWDVVAFVRTLGRR